MIREDLTQIATEYISSIPELAGQVPSPMLVDFVIEKYKQHRNYPSHFDTDKIDEDILAHKTTIAMGVVDMFMRIGAEGEINHTEPNVSRTYENAYISASLFNDVLPFVKTI